MDLKTILPKKKSSKEYYWSLILEQGWVQAGIWKIVNGTSNVLSVGPSTPWETDEELISAVDTALSAVVQKIEEDVGEPEKTVVGVPGSWVHEGKIKEKYLNAIKKISKELSLVPTGFVVISEAIAHLIKSKEGTLLTGVVLGIGKNDVDLVLFSDGKILKSETVSRSVSIIDDVVEGLTRFGGAQLPARFILYDGKKAELDEAKEALSGYDWKSSEKLKFLHPPKMDVVSPDEKVLSVSLAGAIEMVDAKTVTLDEGKKEETHEEETNVQAVDAAEIGFTVGSDVSEIKESEVQKDISQEYVQQQQKELPAIDQQPEEPKKSLIDHFPKIALSGFFAKFKRKPKKESAFSKDSTKGKRAFQVGITLLILLMVAGIAAWWFFPKAEVIVYVTPKKIEKEIVVTVDSEGGSSNFDSNTISGKMINSSVSGDKTKSTTGTKTVGEKSKGTVEVRNGTSSGVRLTSGTVLSASNDLEFVTNETASVSAALSPSDPGTVNIDVTAGDIGSEYNLAKDEVFEVGNYPKSEVDAKATSDFSGGSSSEISAVSEEDRNSLESELTDELLKEVKDDLINGLSEDELLIEESLISEPTSRDFSNQVGDEADTLKLALTLDTVGIIVTQDNLFEVVKKELEGQVPEGFNLKDEQVDLSFKLVGEDNGVYELEVSVTANLLPEANPDDIAGKITGKYPQLAKDFLTSIPGFTRAEISLKPSLPGKLGTLPRVEKNITVIIAAER